MQRRFFKKLTAFLIAAVFLLTAAFSLANVMPVLAESSSSGVCTTVKEIHKAFPESYWENLDALIKKHPDWKFIAFNTGLSWSEVFTNEAEMYPTRNLIQYIADEGSAYYHPTSWFSTKEIEFPDQEGSIFVPFIWAKNEWTVCSAPDWIQASEEAIAYCMDPRNWLYEEQIFQFFDQTSPASEAAVQAVFDSVQGSDFWVRDGKTSDLYITGKDGKKQYLTYTQAISRIAEELEVNPVVLATRIVQEQGLGTSPLISGTKEFTVIVEEEIEVEEEDENGEIIIVKKTVEKEVPVEGGYYNYFNIEATDGTGEANMELIYTNGLREAYREGWDTRYKALLGGAGKFASMYIKRGQSTMYMQKFMVDSSSYGLFWKQYMQSLTTPQIEARRYYNSFKAADCVDSDFTFVIPVFNDMPETLCAEPTKDGNPNYKLGSIYVNGKKLKEFKTDTLVYTLPNAEEDVTSVKLNIHAYAPTSTVKVGDSKKKQDLAVEVPLSYGDNEIKILCVAENGSKRTYKIKILRLGKIMYGDVNDDTKFDIIDINMMVRHMRGKAVLKGQQFEAADINGDGKIDIVDINTVVRYLRGKIKEVPQR